MDMELKSGKMAQSTMVNGLVIKQMVMVHFVTQMEMSMKVNGSMTKPMDTELISMQMELHT